MSRKGKRAGGPAGCPWCASLAAPVIGQDRLRHKIRMCPDCRGMLPRQGRS